MQSQKNKRITDTHNGKQAKDGDKCPIHLKEKRKFTLCLVYMSSCLKLIFVLINQMQKAKYFPRQFI